MEPTARDPRAAGHSLIYREAAASLAAQVTELRSELAAQRSRGRRFRRPQQVVEVTVPRNECAPAHARRAVFDALADAQPALVLTASNALRPSSWPTPSGGTARRIARRSCCVSSTPGRPQASRSDSVIQGVPSCLSGRAVSAISDRRSATRRAPLPLISKPITRSRCVLTAAAPSASWTGSTEVSPRVSRRVVRYGRVPGRGRAPAL